MLRDITLGQYYPSDSVIHKMDPRVKLFGTIVFIISLFLFQKISVYVLATGFLAAVIMISTTLPLTPMTIQEHGTYEIMITAARGCCDHDLKSAVFFYGQGIEGDFCADDDHRCV